MRTASGRHPVRSPGFTLIEILVVVALIALLIAILLPSLHRARMQARQTLCLSNLRMIGVQMGMYQSAYRGWLPVGPVDKMSYVDKYADPPRIYETPEYNTEPVPWANCHWGGHRAEYIHAWNPKYKDVPEKLARPLTAFMYPRTGLDSPTPVFECPSDVGTPYWQPLEPGRPYYRVCGNSYYVNIWGSTGKTLSDPFPSVLSKRSRNVSSIVLAEEAMLFELVYQRKQEPGWHEQFSRHNILFLDFHAENKYVDSRNYYGPGWMFVQYWDIMDFYK